MDMFDEARAMTATMELCHLTQRELATRLGVSQSYVANKLRLLDFSDEDISLVRKLGLTERHARAILPLGEGARGEVIREVAKRSLSVRECEALVSMRRMPTARAGFSRARGVELLRCAEEAMRDITRSLIEGGVTARLGISGEGDITYMTLRIENP